MKNCPALRKNPRYLIDRHIRVFSSWQSDAEELDSSTIDWENVSRSQMGRYKLRQDPGPWNALGRVKFVFPNQHSVYLHDTPSHDLFSHSARAFSHGCIRVSKPLKLALFCLERQGDDWTESRVEEIASAGERKVVSLKTPMPVHIIYQTTWVDENGTIRFSNDIYDRDKRFQEVLGIGKTIQ